MRIIRAWKQSGPLVETIAAVGVGSGLLYVYATNLSAGAFPRPDHRNLPSLRADQDSEQASYHDAAFDPGDDEIFAILDSKPTVDDAPERRACRRKAGSNSSM